MSALSFVALELQTTHLDPASVSQASYVKLVNSNITRIAAWSVIPPTAADTSTNFVEDAMPWGETLPQLNMMVGPLPVVSYYRDADKEVFQAASRHVGQTPPELHWLDCRELARKYLPDLPEFQLSTVLKALHLFTEYGDSDSVEQTAQIVLELARRENKATVEELWGDLYDQPDKILGLDAGLEGLNFVATPETEPATEDAPAPERDETQAGTPAEDSGTAAGDDSQASGGIDEEPPVDDVPVVNQEPESTEPDKPGPIVPEPTNDEAQFDDASGPADHLAADGELEDRLAVHNIDVEDPVAEEEPEAEHAVPQTLDEREEFDEHPEPVEETELEAGPSRTDDGALERENDSAEEQTLPAAEPAETEPNEPKPVVDASSSDSQPEQVAVATRSATSESNLADAPERSMEEPHRTRKSNALRILGFIGVFGFGLLTVVGLVLTIMAVMLFFTENTLLLETKIAGVVLTGALSLLSMLMTTISFQSFRNN